MGYNSIKMVASVSGSEVQDYRLQGKYTTSVLVGDVPKSSGFETQSDKIVFTDGTTVNVGDLVTANFEV